VEAAATAATAHDSALTQEHRSSISAATIKITSMR
jgi:hypothetical protein